MFTQEIYYVTTGKYRTRKALHLIFNAQGSYIQLKGVLTPEQYREFRIEGVPVGQLPRLPVLNVTPSQYKHYYDQRATVIPE